MERTVRAGEIREGSESFYSLNWALLFQSPSSRIKYGESGKNGYIMKELLILCAFSEDENRAEPPEDNTSAWTLSAQELLTWAIPSVFICTFSLYQATTFVAC